MEIGILESDIRSAIVGLFVVVIVSIFNRLRKSQIKQDIESLELDKQLINAMNKSSSEANRMGFRSVAALFLVLFASLIAQSTYEVLKDGLAFFSVLSLAFQAIGFAISIRIWRRYEDLADIESANQRINKKIDALHEKMK